MKKIGYIYRYDKNEEKGILVYGYNKSPFWNSPAPILFSKEQCKSSIKTGVLVYFEIDENNNISEIETASIFNFDRKLLMSLVSLYGANDWDKCEKNTHICYQNIAELKERVEVKVENTSTPKEVNVSDDDERFWSEWGDLFEIIDDAEDDIFLNNNSMSTGEYRKITLPKSIKKEFDLFGTQFPTIVNSFLEKEEICKNQTIIIDLLNPIYWIPKIPTSRKNYYGKNANECIDLFEILVLKRRNAYEKYLNSIRNSRNLWKLDKSIQQALYPELFQDNCVSRNWGKLLERLPDQEVKAVYNYCTLLQPVLPESFCIKNLDLLSEGYGFPSIYIAEKFLANSIHKIVTATEYCHYKQLLHNVKKCNVNHLPDEGIPFCSIDKKKLNNLSRQVARKLIKVLSHIKVQISHAVPNMKACQFDFFDEYDINLKLKIGQFYDYIEKIVSQKSYLFCMEVKNVIKFYNDLPESTHCFFDFYLSNEFKSKIVHSLCEKELSPYQLHLLLETLSQWISESFFDEISVLVSTTYSTVTDISELKDAYEYRYIAEEEFVKNYQILSEKRTDYQCLNDLYDCFGFCLPEETQLYILRRVIKNYELEIVEEINLEYTTYSHVGKYYKFPGDKDVYSLNDFLEWMNKNTNINNTKYNNSISKSVCEQIQWDIMSNLSADVRWFLFENRLVFSPGIDNIKKYLAEGYSKHNLNKKYFNEDCFQQQMTVDVKTLKEKGLICLIIDRLKPIFRENIFNKIQGFGKLYLWSLNPNNTVDWDVLKEYFFDLPSNSQKRVFRYLFLLHSHKKIYSKQEFLQMLTDILINSKTTSEGLNKVEKNEMYEMLFTNGNVLAALGVLLQIIKIKSESIERPITYSEIEPLINIFHGTKATMLKALKDFFEECTGWWLLSHERSNPECFSRNGYVIKVYANTDDKNEYKYKLFFYDTPLDINGYEANYNYYSDIEEAEEVFKKNFNYQHEEGGYIISPIDVIRLKEYMIYYYIDDDCDLFDDERGFREDQGYGIPEHQNYPICYKRNNLFVCNCGLYKDLDPFVGIPYRWCKKAPCTRRFTFLRPDNKWEYFKFADLLWIVMNGEITLEQLWNINSEISLFINNIAFSEKEALPTIKSETLS